LVPAIVNFQTAFSTWSMTKTAAGALLDFQLQSQLLLERGELPG
jgi:hypothetical protein